MMWEANQTYLHRAELVSVTCVSSTKFTLINALFGEGWVRNILPWLRKDPVYSQMATLAQGLF